VYIQISETCECVNFHCDVTKLRKCRAHVGLSSEPSVITGELRRGRQECWSQRRRCDYGNGDWSDVIAGLKDGERHESRTVGHP
jgi:hypothetical protein